MHYNCHNAELDLSGNSYGWYGLDGQRKGYWAGSTGRILCLSCQRCAFFILLDMDSGADLDSDSKPNGCTETAPLHILRLFPIWIEISNYYCINFGNTYPYLEWDRSPWPAM